MLLTSHSYSHRTLHDATRQDNPQQENRVMCGGLRHDATRQDKNRALSQISNNVRSLTTRPDFCLVASCRRPPHITHFSCRELSRRVVSCNVRWALFIPSCLTLLDYQSEAALGRDFLRAWVILRF